jgi:ABC-2 type transport system permease protein
VLKETGGDVAFTLRLAGGESFLYWASMLFLPPLLTMRMISEEARSGMLEFLLTAPVSDSSVVIGKFLAALGFLGIFWLSTIAYAVTLHALGAPPDWPPVIGGYVGALLVSGLFLAIGLLSSALFATPALSAFVAMVLSLFLLVLPFLTSLVGWEWLREGVGAIDVVAQFQRSFLIGVLDTQVLVFFLSWTGFFLFLAIRAVEVKRWR